MASNFSSLILSTKGGGKNLLRFVTGIRYTASVAKMINNITFLYDPNWNYAEYEETSLPISFFFVKKWQEVDESEISTKPMMFYNAQQTKSTQTVNGAVMNIVADNNVIQPRVYKLDVLVPFRPDAYFEQFQFDPDTLANTLAFVTTTGADGGESASKVISAVGRVLSTSIATMRAIFTALSVDLSVASLSSLMLAQNELNKISLDAMRRNHGILKMKMWNGWKFKYVMLKSKELEKSGELEGFYEGTLTVQEVPILNVGLTKKDVSDTPKGSSLLSKLISASAKDASETLTNKTEG